MENIKINNVVPVSKRCKPSCKNNLMDILSMFNESEDEETDDVGENTPIVASINQYVAEPCIPSDANPFVWWDINKHRMYR